ncbi:hypothetical protein [Rhizobium ruizarguesonis]|uniref:hypothetical protein n=1 Tax=Rhizobium ruizarguesonis TaxID=2081791 RepID=UPI0029623BDD|nr:hypothetical protein [Rhizobium ruizarguesonis]
MATDCCVAPRLAPRTWQTFLIEDLRDITWRNAIGVHLEDPPDGLRLGRIDVAQALDPVAVRIALL